LAQAPPNVHFWGIAPRWDLAVSPQPSAKELFCRFFRQNNMLLPYSWAIPPDVYLRGPLPVTRQGVSVRTPHLTVAGRYPERCPQQREKFSLQSRCPDLPHRRKNSPARGLGCLGSEIILNKFAQKVKKSYSKFISFLFFDGLGILSTYQNFC